MRAAVIISEKDEASVNIGKHLLESDNVSVHRINDDSVYADNLEVDADVVIFASRHSGQSGLPLLLVHFPGNWNKAELGGKERNLCVSSPDVLKELFLELNKQDEYKVTMEATHHGPAIRKPCVYIEIGSDAAEWNNEKAGKIIADAIANAFSGNIRGYPSYAGIGGNHYCDNFSKILRRTDMAIGHVCPKYMLPFLDEDMLLQAINRSDKELEGVILDWKGLGKEKQRIVHLLSQLGVEYLRTDRV